MEIELLLIPFFNLSWRISPRTSCHAALAVVDTSRVSGASSADTLKRGPYA